MTRAPIIGARGQGDTCSLELRSLGHLTMQTTSVQTLLGASALFVLSFAGEGTDQRPHRPQIPKTLPMTALRFRCQNHKSDAHVGLRILKAKDSHP